MPDLHVLTLGFPEYKTTALEEEEKYSRESHHVNLHRCNSRLKKMNMLEALNTVTEDSGNIIKTNL